MERPPVGSEAGQPSQRLGGELRPNVGGVRRQGGAGGGASASGGPTGTGDGHQRRRVVFKVEAGCAGGR